MYAELYQYLLHYKVLPVPGIGTFLLVKQPSNADFPNRLINAPAYSISHKPVVEPFPRQFFSWLGHMLGMTDREAVSGFNEFAGHTRDQILAGATIYWKGLGTLTKQPGGEIKFSPDQSWIEDPVRALKVIRENAGHTVRVGEDEKTSAEMTRMLTVQETKRTHDWLWPALLAFLAVLFIGWYLSANGVSTGATANKSKIRAIEGSRGYELIR